MTFISLLSPYNLFANVVRSFFKSSINSFIRFKYNISVPEQIHIILTYVPVLWIPSIVLSCHPFIVTFCSSLCLKNISLIQITKYHVTFGKAHFLVADKSIHSTLFVSVYHFANFKSSTNCSDLQFGLFLSDFCGLFAKKWGFMRNRKDGKI